MSPYSSDFKDSLAVRTAVFWLRWITLSEEQISMNYFIYTDVVHWMGGLLKINKGSWSDKTFVEFTISNQDYDLSDVQRKNVWWIYFKYSHNTKQSFINHLTAVFLNLAALHVTFMVSHRVSHFKTNFLQKVSTNIIHIFFSFGEQCQGNRKHSIFLFSRNDLHMYFYSSQHMYLLQFTC